MQKILLLNGYPGVGKYTIAKELAETINAKLIDNHLISNPIMSLFDTNQPYPKDVWEHTSQIRKTVMNAIKTLSSSRDFSYIFTNVLYQRNTQDQEIYQQIKNLADAVSSQFIPIELTCDLSENQNRIIQPSRSARFKMTCPDALRRSRDNHTLLAIEHDHLLKLEITTQQPHQSAAAILDHLKSL